MFFSVENHSYYEPTNKNKESEKCSRCHKFGHNSFNCNKIINEKCSKCDGVGHTEDYCPYNINESNLAKKTNKEKYFSTFKNIHENNEDMKNKKLVCSRCGKSGHDSFACSAEITCLNCGETGHLKNKCMNPPKSKSVSLLEDWEINETKNKTDR